MSYPQPLYFPPPVKVGEYMRIYEMGLGGYVFESVDVIC